MSGERCPGVLRFTFGDSPVLADELLALVIAGVKTATCGDLAEIEAKGWAAVVGDRAVARDGAGRDACLLETTEVSHRRFCDVDAAFAHDEGEDDRSLESWRREHRRYFERNGGWADDMMLYCERFRVVVVFARAGEVVS